MPHLDPAPSICPPPTQRARTFALLCLFGIAALVVVPLAAAHNVSADNRSFVEALNGPAPIAYLYLGAKHMVTGLDHVFFLIGVVFFLRKLPDIVTYVSLFTIGHSLTLLIGVLAGISVNPFVIDAIIGLSVVYKAFENIGGFDKLFGAKLDMRAAVFGFGLAHGLGLATKLQDLALSENGLLINLLSFNAGVEIGQVLVLLVIVSLLNVWRPFQSFPAGARWANIALMVGGFVLIGQHLAGLILTGGAHA